jgi:uncharacterized membrane protein YecN with MAPEG domain
MSTPASDPHGDDTTRRRRILSSAPVIVPATLAALALAYLLLPPLHGLEQPVARFALATRWLAVAMLPYVAVCTTIATNRFLEGSHDPTRHEESARLQVHCRVMQNTLEQLAWFGVCAMASAPMLSSSEARILPIASVAFVVARLVYWRGYLQPGTIGRAPGVQATFTLNGALLVLVVLLAIR